MSRSTCQPHLVRQGSPPMHFTNLQPGLSAPLPRADDDDDDDEPQVVPAKREHAPVAVLVQKKFLEQRKIFLWGAVTDETAKDITEKLLYLESASPGKDITFYINSPGGSITAGMAGFDPVKVGKPPITGVGTGLAASRGRNLRPAPSQRRRAPP